MSVTEFYNEFGGSSKGNLRWHFKTLVEHGWLRWVRDKQVGRGRPQSVYRATELALYDDECAAELPVSVRAAFTTRILQQMGERVASALKVGALSSRNDRLLSGSSLQLDEHGWAEAMNILAGCFRSLALEQTDAKVRLCTSDEIPRLMMVIIAGFESPRPSERGFSQPKKESGTVPIMDFNVGMPLETRLAKVFSDPINIRIVNEVSDAARSPSELEAMIGLDRKLLYRKCENLERFGWVSRVEEKTGGSRRGATEVYYRATQPPIDTDLWPKVPDSAKAGPNWQALHEFYKRAVEAIGAQTSMSDPIVI